MTHCCATTLLFGASASSAVAFPTKHVSVLLVEFVAAYTHDLFRIYRSRIAAAKYVLFRGYHFEMRGINARWVAAEMIQLKSVGDVLLGDNFPRKSMRANLLSAVPETTVGQFVGLPAEPNPTAAVVLLYVGEEADKRIDFSMRSHVHAVVLCKILTVTRAFTTAATSVS